MAAKPKVKTAEPAKKAEPLPPAISKKKFAPVAAKKALATPGPPNRRISSRASQTGMRGKDAGKESKAPSLPDIPSLPDNYDGPVVAAKGDPNGAGGLPSMPTVEGINLPPDYVYEALTKIRGNFSYPSTVRVPKPLVCAVMFRINLDGRITDVSVSKSTGDPVLDDYAKRALELTLSLRPLADVLPKDFKENHITAGLAFTFGEGAQ